MPVSKRALVSAALFSLAFSATGAVADDAGQVEYENACAVCHGPTGMGHGPLSEFMTVNVPDLTMLSERNGGVFPMLDVIQIIDGRTGVRPRGHGTEMPVWGNQFKAEAGDAGLYGSEVVVRGRILSLAYFIQSIQTE